MIFANKNSINTSGAVDEVLTDLTLIVRSLNGYLSEKMGEETARTLIDKSITVGLMSEEELNAAHRKIIMEGLV